MSIRLMVSLLLLTGAALCDAGASARCELGKIAELPVSMTDRAPVVAAKINGVDAHFIVDSGAFYSQITPAKAQEFGLKLYPAPPNITVSGVGGDERISLATVKDFDIVGQSLHKIEFLVGGGEPGNDAAGLIGQNVLATGDAEYDLANGAVRLWEPKGCENANLAYWSKSQAYSVLTFEWISPVARQAMAVAYVNGIKIRVMFDTGSASSFLSASAAKRAGLSRDGAGVVSGGRFRGVGRREIDSWIAPVASFRVGDEDIRGTRLRVAETDLLGQDMLLGADFFLSHRVFVANSLHRLFFTYNGGPVFNLDVSPQVVQSSRSAIAGKPDDAVAPASQAEKLARRGSAEAAREQYDPAIADLTHAMVLAPKDPVYPYELAMADLGAHKPREAMAHLNQTLALDPNDPPARVQRATLRLAGGDRSGAVDDLDQADKTAPRPADVRLQMAQTYMAAADYRAAAAQFDLWIDAHPQDSRQAAALDGSCRARALSGTDLGKGLKDCDASLSLAGKSWATLAARGLLRLRLGDFDRSIADFDSALALNPNNPRALYGRGMAELKKGLISAGNADISAATKLEPGLAQEAKALGLAA